MPTTLPIWPPGKHRGQPARNIESYVLDSAGRIVSAMTRLRWNEQGLLHRAKELIYPAASGR